MTSAIPASQDRSEPGPGVTVSRRGPAMAILWTECLRGYRRWGGRDGDAEPGCDRRVIPSGGGEPGDDHHAASRQDPGPRRQGRRTAPAPPDPEDQARTGPYVASCSSVRNLAGTSDQHTAHPTRITSPRLSAGFPAVGPHGPSPEAAPG